MSKLIKTLTEAKLSFGFENAKLGGTGAYTFSVPAGKTCPGACDCLAHVVEATKIVDGEVKPTYRIVDGKKQKFRCFAASMEVRSPSVYRSRKRNLGLIMAAGGVEQISELIYNSLPPRATIVRVHVGGDFFSESYFLAWMEVARRSPHIEYYAYTKSNPTWVKYMALVPKNFVLTASRGGRHDHLIDKHNLKEALVVYHPEEADALNLQIDHDDSLAKNPKVKKFALLIHSMGKAGSRHNEAMARMRREGIKHGYRKEDPVNAL